MKAVTAMLFGLSATAALAQSATPPADTCSLRPFLRFVEGEFPRYRAEAPPLRSRAAALPEKSGNTVEAMRYHYALKYIGAVPDFAGRLSIARIGCGTGCARIAVADRLSGRVYYPTTLRSVSYVQFRDADGVDSLIYRPDSRLLIAIGWVNEDPQRIGATLYEWRADALRQIRFVPLRELCAWPA